MTKVIIVDEQTSLNKKKDIITIDKEEMIRYSNRKDDNASLEFMKKLPDFVVNNKSVKEWFKYKDTSLWWFSHTRISPQVKRCIIFIDQFENMLESLKPEIIEIKGFYENFYIVSQICKKKNVSLVIPFSSKMRILSADLRRKARKIIVNTNIVAQQKRRKRISLAKRSHHAISDDHNGCVIYVAAESYRRPIYDFKSGKVLRGEHLVHQVLEMLRKKTPLLCVDIDATAKGEFNVLKERLQDEGQYWIPLEILFTNELESECKGQIKAVKNNVRNLFKNEEFRKKIEYKNIIIWNTLEYYFETLLSDAYIPNFIRNIETARNLLTRLSPKSILLPYERGSYALAFIVAANALGIKCVGLQHGLIGKQDPDYAIQSIANSELGFPLPTNMLLFGEFDEKLLVDTFSYPRDRIIVVGNPVYDDIDVLSKDKNKDIILKDLGLSPTKKTVLVGTSMFQKIHGSPDYDVLMIKTVIEKFGNNTNFQIIIKPHPRDNIDVYEKIKNDLNISNLIITYNPIQQLLLLCDVFVCVMSTTILEALVLNKPVILVKISDSIDFDYLSIAKSGTGLEAKLDELEEKILKVLEDKELVSKLNEKGSELARYHFNYTSKGITEKIVNILSDKS